MKTPKSTSHHFMTLAVALIASAAMLASCATQKHLQQSLTAKDSTEKVETSHTATDLTQVKSDSTTTELTTETETVEVVRKWIYDTSKPIDSTGKPPLLAEEITERRSFVSSEQRQRKKSSDSTHVVATAVDSARTTSGSDFSSVLVGSSSSEPAPFSPPLWLWLALASAALYAAYKIIRHFKR